MGFQINHSITNARYCMIMSETTAPALKISSKYKKTIENVGNVRGVLKS